MRRPVFFGKTYSTSVPEDSQLSLLIPRSYVVRISLLLSTALNCKFTSGRMFNRRQKASLLANKIALRRLLVLVFLISFIYVLGLKVSSVLKNRIEFSEIYGKISLSTAKQLTLLFFIR